jgi:nicotinamidase-related amidase
MSEREDLPGTTGDDTEDDGIFETPLLLDPAGAGLLVVDVQERLWPSIHDREAVGRRILQAIRVAGNLELPILVTEQYVKGLGPTLPEVRAAVSEFGAFDPLEKFDFSCLGEPDFVARLAESGIETLALVGIESHVCVLQTALDALDRGLDVFYIAEATGSRDPAHKAEAVARVRDAGGVIGSVEMFAFEALRSSKHPAFKAVQKVIL